ncbi:hypothetical protein HPP92_004104 [Vanilla planifolia]|uniref:Uncharacterized protein n=1 Tax=Vanilla planifolia TaxID=51239 RepID=A0A835S8T6_VANPL|nr:hypothetical protein HPP92_004104 [Vanilla planifolia]
MWNVSCSAFHASENLEVRRKARVKRGVVDLFCNIKEDTDVWPFEQRRDAFLSLKIRLQNKKTLRRRLPEIRWAGPLWNEKNIEAFPTIDDWKLQNAVVESLS